MAAAKAIAGTKIRRAVVPEERKRASLSITVALGVELLDDAASIDESAQNDFPKSEKLDRDLNLLDRDLNLMMKKGIGNQKRNCNARLVWPARRTASIAQEAAANA